MIGRPYVYLAVDTAAQLIAGIYVGLECDETAVMLCLANATRDKVSYCQEYGITINAAQWPSHGLPHEIITDKGSEFFGTRIQELCKQYGLEIQSLPPFRPDEKGLAEKSFDLIQQRYKPLLGGKGVIEMDATERWGTDHRMQSVLNLDEFTQIMIYCVLYLNAGRLLSDAKTSAQKWCAATPSLLDISYEELLLAALPRERVKLTRKGFRIKRMMYVPADMDGLLLGKSYIVAHSPSDSSCAYVLMDNGSFKSCRLASSYAQYDGLSQLEAELLSQEEGKLLKIAEKQEREASVEDIQNVCGVLQTAVAAGERKTKQDGKEIQKNRSDDRRKLT